MTTSTTTRLTAEERREAVLEASRQEFAQHGLHGASTDAIARAAGISQPYLFRLFGSKKELYLESVRRCLDRTLETFRSAASGKAGPDALHAIGEAYGNLIESDRTMLQAQLQAYAGCDDPEVCEVVRRGYGRLVDYVEAVSGAGAADISAFFAQGMLYNVIAAMEVESSDEPWARLLLDGCNQRLEGLGADAT
jgi:AcrR family transcriptional regulator